MTLCQGSFFCLQFLRNLLQVLAATERFAIRMVLGQGACGTIYRGFWNPAIPNQALSSTQATTGQLALISKSSAAAINAAAAAASAAAGGNGQQALIPVTNGAQSQQMGPGGVQQVSGMPVVGTNTAAAATIGFAAAAALGMAGANARARAKVLGPADAARPVVVRVLNRRGLQALQKFCGDNLDLQKYRHHNLVPFLTFCLPGEVMAGGQPNGDSGGRQAACLMYPLVCKQRGIPSQKLLS